MKKGGKKDPLADAQSEKVGKVLSVQDSEFLVVSARLAAATANRIALIC
jgi:hypothetical protein